MRSLNLWIIPLLPALGAAINGLLGKRFSKRMVNIVALGSTASAFAYAVWVALQFRALETVPHIETYATWLRSGRFSVEYGFYLDQLSLVMLLVVTGVGFLIHVYSVGYMEHEGGYYRFFSYMNLFMFFMLTLVMANNYLLMFVGWEGVGLCSYLLIGFFFLRDSAANAGKKAFIVNRIGDFGFLIALFLLIKHFGTLQYNSVFEAVAGMPAETAGAGLLTAIGLLMFVGATGKSAQVPLYVWLPDAMEGPTPVSALIHAATMVTAGVYMVARSNAIFSRAPEALMVVAIIGCLTAILAATIGLVQTDIKRVLAYSTVSQLGYMFLACGVAAYTAGVFHLMTHAFFKALLFLGAGSVIHALGGEQDMRRMGGLRKKIPYTFWVVTAGTVAIAGIPPLAGFFSKDEILWKTWQYSKALWTIGAITAFLTSFYMFRLWFLTFFGERRGALAEGAERAGHGHAAPASGHGHHSGEPHESPMVMIVPLVILAILSIVGGWVGIPHALGGDNHFEGFLAPVVGASTEMHGGAEHAPAHPASTPAAAEHEPAHGQRSMELTLTLASVGIAALGFFLAYLFYYKNPALPKRMAEGAGGLYRTVLNKYYVDELYGALFVRPIVLGSTKILWRGIDATLIDGTINQSAEGAQEASDTLRRMQSGNIRSYAAWVTAGAACVIAYMVWRGLR